MAGFKLGCIADDFTGAGDAASFLTDGGLKTLLIIWPHIEAVSLDGYDAVVIALKSRSIEPDLAVRDSLAAVHWLNAQGAEKIYFKYCSTFDSTPRGNIGPVCDALLEHGGQSYSLLCPSLLLNGRSVRSGKLLVNGIPLAESHMSRHPLNPMWSSEIKVLMEAQSKFPCFTVAEEEYSDEEALRARIDSIARDNVHFYLIPDYYEPEHGEAIVRLFGTLPFLSGGSGLLGDFARLASKPGVHQEKSDATGRAYGRVMLAGSCSDMTRRQVRRWIDAGGRTAMVESADALAGSGRAAELAALYLEHPEEDILYYSSGSSDTAGADTSDKNISSAMEKILSDIARTIFKARPISRLVTAGGETSGAVITALGLSSFAIGESIAPGVPILYPTSYAGLRLVLKSGNFGNEDFFIKVLEK